MYTKVNGNLSCVHDLFLPNSFELKLYIWPALLSILIIPFDCNPGEDMKKLYFTSPEKSISQISNLLRAEDFLTLTSYFNLENTDLPIDDFQSGKYFRGEIIGEKPAGLFKYVKPFSPGFKFSHIEELKNKITRVHLTLEIDQGEGRVLRSMHSFDLTRSEKGFQILP